MGYDGSNESVILLLDISNNEEYTWTDTFNPSSSSSSNSESNSKPSTTIGAIIGLFLDGAALSFGCFYLYRWNKKQGKAIQNTGSII